MAHLQCGLRLLLHVFRRIVGLIFDDKIDELFYHPIPVAIALIVVGIVFIVVENAKERQQSKQSSIGEITYKAAIIIGLFQLIATVFQVHQDQVQQLSEHS